MRGHRALGVGLVVVALVLAANPLYLYQHPDELNTVQVQAQSAVDGPTQDRYRYEDLSPRGRELVATALDAPDNTTTFRGDHRRPAEFSFARFEGPSILAGSAYRVDRDGTTYVVRTYEEPPLLSTERERSRGLITYGLVVGLVGAAYIRREQPLTLGAVIGSVGVALYAANVAYRWAGADGIVATVGAPTPLFLSVLGGIVSLGYLLYRTMRERREAAM